MDYYYNDEMEGDEVGRACGTERRVAWQCFDLNKERQIKRFTCKCEDNIKNVS